MLTVFPPRSDRDVEIGALLGVLCTVVSGRTATYVSAAITTGRRFAEWHATRPNGFDWADPEHREDHRRWVIEPNREEVRHLVVRLRQHRSVVIDPTALPDQSGWEQADYLVFWQKVIEEFAGTMVFAEGWQHSNGCCYEFLVAHASGARTLDHSLRPMTALQALEMIRAAIAEGRTHGVPTAFREAVARELATALDSLHVERRST